MFRRYDAVSFEIVDLLDQGLAYLTYTEPDKHGLDPQSLLASLRGIWLMSLTWRLDGVVGELADGGCEVGEQLWKLLVDFTQFVDMGSGDLVVRLRLLRW